MKSSKIFMEAMVLGTVLLMSFGEATAREIPFRGIGSGSFIGVDIDTNGDGDKGGLTTGIVKSNLGQFALSLFFLCLLDSLPR